MYYVRNVFQIFSEGITRNQMLSLNRIAVAACFVALTGFSLTVAAQTSNAAYDRADEQTREAWRTAIHHNPAPEAGCFTASFPSTKWVAVQCAPAPAYRSAVPIGNREQTIGNGSDFVAEAPSGHTFTSVVGSFPTATGITSEQSVGVPAFGNGGILGVNEYTLQVNTNFYHSAACGSYTKCLAWQQYVVSTNTPVSLTSSSLTNETEVFIEYWLIDYGKNRRASCPSGFINGGADAEGPGVDCVQNTAATLIYKGQLPITDLGGETLQGTATAGGTDAATFTYGGNAYTATVKDSYTDIASGWTEAEFNVFGNAGGSEAEFNTGVSITAKLALTDGSTSAPTCLSPSGIDGTTGETNNLNAGSCTTAGGSAPYLTFTESD
jgi:hypothetical protein